MKHTSAFFIAAMLCACNTPNKPKQSPSTSATVYIKSLQSKYAFSDEVNFYYLIGIKNITTKQIGGVSGILYFNDASTDTLVTAVRIALDHTINPGHTDTIEVTTEYNPNNMEYVTYKHRSLETLHTTWHEEGVAFIK